VEWFGFADLSPNIKVRAAHSTPRWRIGPLLLKSVIVQVAVNSFVYSNGITLSSQDNTLARLGCRVNLCPGRVSEMLLVDASHEPFNFTRTSADVSFFDVLTEACSCMQIQDGPRVSTTQCTCSVLA
jgi:hypothetical protein